MQNTTQNIVINSFTGLIKKAGQSKQLVESDAEIVGITQKVRKYESDSYIYIHFNDRSSIYFKDGGAMLRVNQVNWLDHKDKIQTEWAGMLADLKPRPSKKDPLKAEKEVKARALLVEITGKTEELEGLGWKLAYSWKAKRYEIHPMKLKDNGPAAQQVQPTVDQGQQQ